jgi:cytoskeletal protein RodZ
MVPIAKRIVCNYIEIKGFSMSYFGEDFRREREEKSISLEEVSKATKISTSVLQALENDRFNDLPPSVYVRGFIRSYCRYVGLDETSHLKAYEEAAAANEDAEASSGEEPLSGGNLTRLFLLMALFAALVALFIYDSVLKRSDMREVVVESQESVATMKAEIPVAQEEAAAEKQPSPASPSPIRIVVTCVADSWLEITIDDDRPFDVNLFQGDEICWRGEERIALKVGNAGGLVITVNDLELKPFGESEEVVKLLFEGNAVSLNAGQFQGLQLWERKE